MKHLIRFFYIILVLIITIGIYFDVAFPIGSVIVPLRSDGGLGNQMFRYAAGYALAKKTGSRLYVMLENSEKGDFMLGKFNIPQQNIVYKNKINKKFFNKQYVTEANFFQLAQKNNWRTLIINDDFESEIFFADDKADILEMYQLKDSSKYNINLEQVEHNNAVCVHVRRGDMLTMKDIYLLPIIYQKQAIELIKNIINNPKFIVFSDSIDVVKSELSGDFSFISGDALEDFFLMSKCGNNIVANSTFSWWAAYLNQRSNHLVIAPSPRFNDNFFREIFKDDTRRQNKRALYQLHAYPKDWILVDYNKVQ